jgi:hypothetical protein
VLKALWSDRAPIAQLYEVLQYRALSLEKEAPALEFFMSKEKDYERSAVRSEVVLA